MRFFICADIEGVAGVVSREQSGVATGFEWERARVWMTEEVSAAANAAFAAGCTEVVVCDSHGSGQNILIDRLPANTMLVRGGPRPLMMMQGIEVGRYAGAMLLGHHSGSTYPAGILGHTFKGVAYREVKLNGRTVNESGFNAAIAAHFGVPIIAISGDDAYVAETTELLGDVEAATVKWTYSFMSARCLRPQDAQELIGQTVTKAFRRLTDFTPKPLSIPVTLELEFKHRLPVDTLSLLPIIERTGAYGIRYVGKDITEISRVVSFISRFGSDQH